MHVYNLYVLQIQILRRYPSIKEMAFTGKTYKTSLLRQERYKRTDIGKKSVSDLKKTIINAQFDNSKCFLLSTNQSETVKESDSAFEYIMQARKRLGLQTEPLQNPAEETSLDPRERVVVSSGPIASVKDLRMFSRKLSEINTPMRSELDFVYALIQRKKTGCSVYDLCITHPDKARTQPTYYTISAFNVSEVSKTHSVH